MNDRVGHFETKSPKGHKDYRGSMTYEPADSVWYGFMVVPKSEVEVSDYLFKYHGITR